MTTWLPLPASANAGEIDFLMMLVHGLMLVLFAGWMVYLAWVLFRFRRARQPRADHHGASGGFATWTEVGVVVAEGVLLVAFALPMWYSRTATPPRDPRALVVHVIARQYAWDVQYPGPDGQFGESRIELVGPSNLTGLDRSSPFGKDDIIASALHVPIGRQVVAQLSSMDVIHSFGLPNFRVKQDVIPGMLSTVWFRPTVLGEFDIACSQLCGLGHYRMRSSVIVESDASFQKFLADEAALLVK
jgi:cytochrome c oxidase subunit 2